MSITAHDLAAKVAHLPNGMVRRAAVERGVDPDELMRLVREERRARGLNAETGGRP